MRRPKTIVALAAALLSGIANGYAQTSWEIKESVLKDWYRSSFDTTRVWHPGRIFVSWPDMDLEFRLPWDHDMSGVANLMFRDRSSGAIHRLDYVVNNRRRYTQFEPGRYDAILLYNSGKFVVQKNITFAKGVNTVVDMSDLPVREANARSREWLQGRKFTDPVGGERRLERYDSDAEFKIPGYVFTEDGEVDDSATIVRLPFKEGIERPSSGVSQDGYFELDSFREAAVYNFRITGRDNRTTFVDAKANTWLFIVESDSSIVAEKKPAPDPRPKFEHRFNPNDPAYLWHPEQFHIVWPDMKLDLIFPHDEERSGVANLLFEYKRAGNIGLDWIGKSPDNTSVIRHYFPVDQGNCNVILLYNNGKYIVYENLTLAKGINTVVDMTGLPVRESDPSPRRRHWWWGKFTDAIYNDEFIDLYPDRYPPRSKNPMRVVRSYYDMTGMDKVVGYVFRSDNEGAAGGATVSLPAKKNRESIVSLDGYFELGYETEDIGSMLKFRGEGANKDNEIELTPNSGYLIVLDYQPDGSDRVIGQDNGKAY
jgi:hypothetical protein